MMKRFAVGWLSLCLVAILFPLVMTSGGSVMFESLRSSAVGRAALTAVALSRECVRVYSPRPLRKVVRWWVRLPFGDFFALLVKRRAQRSSRLEEETMQKTPIVSYDRFMTRRRLHTKEVGKDLGAAGAMKALRTSPLDKYQRLSVAFRKRHGLGLSMDDEGVLKSWGGSKIESNEAEEYLHSEVWWEEQRRKRKGRRKGASFPIRLGSVLMRRRQWVKGASLDDSDLESEEGEDQDERMENSFDVSSSDDLESEEGTTHDILLAPTHLQDYNYQNDEEKDGYDDDLDDEWDVKENGDDEWVQKDSNEWDSDEQGWDIEDKCHLSSDEDDERWDHQVDQCDDFQEKDWSDDDEMVETNEDPAESPTLTTAPVEQWGCSKDPLDRSKNWSCAAHRYGGGIHDQSNQNFENLKKRRGGESAQQQQREGVWDSDEDEWRFSRRKLLEEDNSEEYDVNSNNEDIWDADESSVGSDDEESDEPPWNYDSSNDDHHDVMSSYSHEEEIDFAY